MALQITLTYQTAKKTAEFRSGRVTIGRLGETDPPDVDLSPDTFVSRQHAVLEVKHGVCWLTDSGSRSGTQVNGREIRGQGEWRLEPGDTVVIGQTTLQIVFAPDGEFRASGEDQSHPRLFAAPPAGRKETPPLPADGDATKAEESGAQPNIVHTIDTTRGAILTPESASVAEKRLGLLLALPQQFSAQAGRGELLQTIMDRVVQVIPAARRGALLLRDPQQDALLLRAYVSADEPVVSETLARRAVEEKRGYIWRLTPGADPSRSVRELKIVSGMFAPVQWKERVFGVICVDSPVVTDTFEETDLQFLIALGQIAGMALSEQQTQIELQHNGKLLHRLLANFSPKIREVLLEQARLGKLRPGGTKSPVTILFCDICNFTRRASQMDAHDVVDMLNHYFQALTEAILRHDGTIDKFVGDAVLAVFGSPEPDAQQHVKAVRAAVALQEAVEATSKLRASRGDVTCKVRIGVHTGEVFHGFVGTSDRLEFTVIGDAVNRACRYCEAAGEGEILISQDIFQRVFNQVKAEKTLLQTKEGELSAYRLTGLKT